MKIILLGSLPASAILGVAFAFAPRSPWPLAGLLALVVLVAVTIYRNR